MQSAASNKHAGESGTAAHGEGSSLACGCSSGLSAGAVDAGDCAGADPGAAVSSSESVDSPIELEGMSTVRVTGPRVCTGSSSAQQAVSKQHGAGTCHGAVRKR